MYLFNLTTKLKNMVLERNKIKANNLNLEKKYTRTIYRYLRNMTLKFLHLTKFKHISPIKLFLFCFDSLVKKINQMFILYFNNKPTRFIQKSLSLFII